MKTKLFSKETNAKSKLEKFLIKRPCASNFEVLDHPHSSYFKTSFRTEYFVLLIEILSFIFISHAPIFLDISTPSQLPLVGPTRQPYLPPHPPHSSPPIATVRPLSLRRGVGPALASPPPSPATPPPTRQRSRGGRLQDSGGAEAGRPSGRRRSRA
jgi:hypothetical protein